MQGIIQQARPSKSGKTLSVQINNIWYTTKSSEFEQMVGHGGTARGGSRWDVDPGG